MDTFNITSSKVYLSNRHKVVCIVTFSVLLLSLVIGAKYRIGDIDENFSVNAGFEFFVNMASHFWTSPGGYNFETGLKMIKNPDGYIFTRHPEEPATGSFENEKGWAFILSLIFREGTKGMQNLAMIVVRCQMMIDLFIVILLFYAGRSIIGLLGGSFAAVLYALFKPSIRMMSWVSYYYWAIPFSALSLFFWTVLYRPERKKYSLKILSLAFLLYGMLIGFATSVRLGFLFLPLFMSSIIFFRERNFKRSMVLLLAMLIGQGILLVSQILITHRYYGKYTLSVRGKWHHVVSGFGAYPNPFGIKDSGDRTAVEWGIKRGGPELNQVGIQEYDKFMKKQALCLIKERPDIFLENFRTNLFSAVTMTPKDATHYVGGPAFYGIMDSDKKYDYSYDPKIVKFAHFFPWFVLFTIFVLFFFRRQSFILLITVIAQGLYLLGIICIYFSPGDHHATAYFPIYVLLLAVSLATLVKGIVCISRGGLRCGINKNGLRYWPAMIRECFCEDGDIEYHSVKIKRCLIVFGIIVIPAILALVSVLYIAGAKKDIDGMSIDAGTVRQINDILKPETNGSFENWTNGDSFAPDEWRFIREKEAEIHRATEDGNILFGESSAKIQASSFWNAWLYFNIYSDKLYLLLGKTIMVEGYIKSENKAPNKVYISICNGINIKQFPKVYYQNSGDWERLSLVYKVPYNIKHMVILLNVDSGVNAPVYFDGIKMSIKD